MLKVLLICLLLPITAYSKAVDYDCKPEGVIEKSREMWNPKKFWSEQPMEIQQKVSNRKILYKAAAHDRKKEAINDKLDTENLMILISDLPAKDKKETYDVEMSSNALSEEIRKELDAYERKVLTRVIEWGKRCSAYARDKISSLK